MMIPNWYTKEPVEKMAKEKVQVIHNKELKTAKKADFRLNSMDRSSSIFVFENPANNNPKVNMP